MESTATFYNALVTRDSSFEGIFVAAIRTTGIFCRPTCSARKPLRKNVEFFRSASEAMQHGYRPCLVCRPPEPLGNTPASLRAVLQKIEADPSVKIRDRDLIQFGIEPATARRWFLKHHQLTFQAYQRMRRINAAFKKISSGHTVTSAAFGSGYESLSGFGDSFRSITGLAPKDSRQRGVIDMKRINTILGPMIVCMKDEQLCLLEFTDRRMLEKQLIILSKRLNASVIQGSNPHFAGVEKEIGEYFEGNRKQFSMPLLLPGSEFQQRVWQHLLQIPYGETRSYLGLATGMGQPYSVRAVANANGMNRLSLIVPCHRVIGEDGSLTGYGGGLWRKKWLLDMEKSSK